MSLPPSHGQYPIRPDQPDERGIWVEYTLFAGSVPWLSFRSGPDADSSTVAHRPVCSSQRGVKPFALPWKRTNQVEPPLLDTRTRTGVPRRMFGQFADRPPSEYTPVRLSSTQRISAVWVSEEKSGRPRVMLIRSSSFSITSVVMSVHVQLAPVRSVRSAPQATSSATR